MEKQNVTAIMPDGTRKAAIRKVPGKKVSKKMSAAEFKRLTALVENAYSPQLTHRFFVVQGGPAMAKHQQLAAVEKERTKRVDALRKRLKADAVYRVNYGQGIAFFWRDPSKQDPNILRHFKEHAVHYDKYKGKEERRPLMVPKRNSGFGKELAKEIADLTKGYTAPEAGALSALGLHVGMPMFVTGNRWYGPAGVYLPKLHVLLVKVPFKKYPREVLSAYRKLHATGDYNSMNMEAALWTKTKDMVELKESDFHKYIEDNNALIGKKSRSKNS